MNAIIRSPLSWVLLFVIIMGCEGILFWGGYFGVLAANLFFLIKVLAVLVATVVLGFAAALLIREGRRYTIGLAIGVCALAVANLVLMRGCRSAFFLGAKMRIVRTLDPRKVQSWADSVLQAEHTGETYIAPKDIPSFVKIPGWRLVGASIRNEGLRHIDIVWGSGMAGNFVISVGSTLYKGDCVMWQPGLYLHTSD